MVKNITTIIGVLLLILWQLFAWLEYVPQKGMDPYIDLTKTYYLITVLPFSVIGVIISAYLLNKKDNQKKSIKALSWLLFIVSILSVPPLFKLARYIFYPFVQ